MSQNPIPIRSPMLTALLLKWLSEAFTEMEPAAKRAQGIISGMISPEWFVTFCPPHRAPWDVEPAPVKLRRWSTYSGARARRRLR